jgi:hypothetical protein
MIQLVQCNSDFSGKLNTASAARMNAGAAACEMTCDSWLIDGVSGIVASK